MSALLKSTAAIRHSLSRTLTMAATNRSFVQDPHRYVLTFTSDSPSRPSFVKGSCYPSIPGPIEISDKVLYAGTQPSMSHMSLDFAGAFRDSVRMTRLVLNTHDGQPFLIAGSGTLGWDQVSANLVEPDENVLVLNCGYFADGFVDCLEAYGAKVDQLKAEVGGTVKLSDIEAALKQKKYKIITVTHVDTSTGTLPRDLSILPSPTWMIAVLSDIKAIGELVYNVSRDTVVVVDAVCSAASEEIKMDSWCIDVVITASQKGLGAPPGLSIVVAGRKAIKVLENRSTPVRSYYASWKKWLPIMQGYERNTPAYFATPPVNLIYAYRASLAQITRGPISLQDRLQAHKDVSRRFRKAAEELGFKSVPLSEEISANGMTALYYPEGIVASDIIPRLLKKDIIVAGGIHSSIKVTSLNRHMGVTVVEPERGDIDRVLKALEEVLEEARNARAALYS
ncbi:PLP-dependent transferase [Lanmaoa asiatica]|nr:PLP-dependent transferase [Lanmaoa asiatica]